MLTPDAKLKFLNEKILKAQGSSCCIETGRVLLETPVVETEKIDHHGNIYLFIPRPQGGSIRDSAIKIIYRHSGQAYCIKIAAVVVARPTRLKIVLSDGNGQMQYLKIKARILSIEYIEQHKPPGKIRNVLNELSRKVSMLLFLSGSYYFEIPVLQAGIFFQKNS